MTGLRVVLLGVRFAVEVAALVAFGVFGTRAADGAVGVTLAVGLPIAAAVFWGLFVAPKAASPLGPVVKEALALAVFAAATAALLGAGEPRAAVVFAVVAVIDSTLLWRAGR